MLRLYFAEGAPSAHLLRRHSLGFVSGSEGSLQGALRPNVQCSIAPGREAPFGSEIVPDQDLSDLHGIQGSALA